MGCGASGEAGGAFEFAPVSTGLADMRARNQSVAGFADATWFFKLTGPIKAMEALMPVPVV